jgi:hypothetical protein
MMITWEKIVIHVNLIASHVWIKLSAKLVKVIERVQLYVFVVKDTLMTMFRKIAVSALKTAQLALVQVQIVSNAEKIE